MGRRPNQLILEYFERGPKLEDASNRYQHTCKSCGEKVRDPALQTGPRPWWERWPLTKQKFPKGRIDSLTNHLVKKCPALPLRDRQRALLQFHELPVPDTMAQTSTASGTAPLQNAPKMSLPFAPSKQLSALETLAEVSRQHLDLTGQRMPDKQPAQNNNHVSHAGLLDEFLVDDRPDGADLGSMSQAMDMSNAPTMATMYQFNGSLHHSPTASPHMDHMPLPSSTSMNQMVPSLVMAASAANDLMPLTNGLHMDPDLSLPGNGISGMSFHTPGRGWPNLPSSSLDPLLQDHTKEEHVHKSMAHPRPIAMNPNPQTHFTTDFSVNHKVTKPKVRGRFSDTRRREVQEVRKRGACIRCRMLKKPCSEGNPCNTCQNVESARLWKQPCIRTRIADEFGLYSAGLHTTLAHHAVYQARGLIRLNPIPGRIEATHHSVSGHYATFVPLKCQQSLVQNAEIDPAMFAALGSPDLELIDTDDDIGGKLDLYIKRMGPTFLEIEDSEFMKTTIRTSLSLTPTNQDLLLPKALELWNFTRILTSQNLEWQLFSNPSLAPTAAPSTLSETDMSDPARRAITLLSHSSSYNLIKTQLQGATEKRATALARIVMNDLERRLLQRQQANPFETFLVAVILVACVERMCWLFRTWEVEAPSNNDNTMEEHRRQSENEIAMALQSPPEAQQQQRGARHGRWPLDKRPGTYSQQGERFSDMLHMLLKMRGVPPKPAPRSADGVLAIGADDGDEKVRDWYDGIAVTAGMLDERAGARFSGEDAREWELKFVGKIIRGD
ncbi:hypothetical protein ACEQ8H_005338 [Pleosporales sp. CAS-2024a]